MLILCKEKLNLATSFVELTNRSANVAQRVHEIDKRKKQRLTKIPGFFRETLL
jgi:hypothetical protein